MLAEEFFEVALRYALSAIGERCDVSLNSFVREKLSVKEPIYEFFFKRSFLCGHKRIHTLQSKTAPILPILLP